MMEMLTLSPYLVTGQGEKLLQEKLILDVRKISFTGKTVKHWNRQPTEMEEFIFFHCRGMPLHQYVMQMDDLQRILLSEVL